MSKAKSKTESKKQEPVPVPVPAPAKDTVRVVAVICPMHSPDDNVLIPDDAKGVLIKKSSWSSAQLERGLLRIVR